MNAVLIRTGSVPIHSSSFLPGSPRVSRPAHDSFACVFSGEKTELTSPRISLHLEVNRRSICRALSDPDLIRSGSDLSGSFSRLGGVGSKSFPAKIPEEDYASESDDGVVGGIGSLMLTERGSDQRSYAGDWPRSGVAVEELAFPGGGIGKGRTPGSGSGGNDFGTGGSADRSKIGEYYQEMLKSNPTNSLLLRNYGKFLHEVERDTVKAEEYYGRAILASPGDGEVLSLYGRLIWETQRDENRAKCYFDQAVSASPEDCMVMGSYAQFMWEAEEDEEDVEVSAAAAMVEAF